MWRHGDQPPVITTVPVSPDDEFDRRRKKYAIMMATRAVCVVLAASFVRVSVAVALAFAIAGLVLPWCAVIIANDRPAKKRQARLGHVQRQPERALPAGADDRTVDG
jgi:Flp pilus assembly protein TadB